MTLIGFLIYGPVMLIGLHALELHRKKQRYSSRFHRFIRLLRWYCVSFSCYRLGSTTLRLDGGFYVMIGGGVLAVLLLFIVMVEEGKHKAKLGDTYGTK